MPFVIVIFLAEGQYIVIDGVKKRNGFGTHTNGKDKYIGEWQHDSMHGQGRNNLWPENERGDV